MQNLKKKYRLDYVDMAKGVAIIGVFFGHHLVLSDYITKWFWSWHIPIFFFITGFCSRKLYEESFQRNLKNSLTDLILPFCITSVCLTTLIILITHQNSVLQSPFKFPIEVLSDILFKETPMWFLLALFWGRIISNALKSQSIEKNVFYCVVFFEVGLTIGTNVINSTQMVIPLSILRGLMAPLYIYAGRLSRFSFNKIENILSGGGIFLSVASIIFVAFGSLVTFNFFYYDFPIGIMNVVTSSALCICILIMSWKLCNIKCIICKPFIFVGKYTLYILCAHTIELQLRLHRFFPDKIQPFAPFFLFIFICFSILLIKKIPIINNLYKLRG